MKKQSEQTAEAEAPKTFMSISLEEIRAMGLDTEYSDDDDEMLKRLNDHTSRKEVAKIIDRYHKGMSILELKCDDGFSWEMKIMVEDFMKKVHHQYNVHFVPNPTRYFRDLAELQQDENDVISDAQEEMPLEGTESEKDKKLKHIAKMRAQVIERLEGQRRDCPEISFQGTVSKNEWKNDGTVLWIALPASMVNRLNDNRVYLKDEEGYLVRLEKIGE